MDGWMDVKHIPYFLMCMITEDEGDFSWIPLHVGIVTFLITILIKYHAEKMIYSARSTLANATCKC